MSGGDWNMPPDVIALYILRTVQVDIERSIHRMWAVRLTTHGTHEIAVNNEDEPLATAMLELLQLSIFGAATAMLHCRRPDIFRSR